MQREEEEGKKRKLEQEARRSAYIQAQRKKLEDFWQEREQKRKAEEERKREYEVAYRRELEQRQDYNRNLKRKIEAYRMRKRETEQVMRIGSASPSPDFVRRNRAVRASMPKSRARRSAPVRSPERGRPLRTSGRVINEESEQLEATLD